MNSQRNFSNSFVVDGLSANDDAAGLSGAFYGLDVVNEFQVVTSGGQAEFGRALGGYVNVVTKSGTNAVHGDLYGYFRNSRFNAANALSHTALPLTQAQYGASARRSARPGSHFLFRQFRAARPEPIRPDHDFSRQRCADQCAGWRQSGYPRPADLDGPLSEPGTQRLISLAKVDHQFSQKDQFSAATASMT